MYPLPGSRGQQWIVPWEGSQCSSEDPEEREASSKTSALAGQGLGHWAHYAFLGAPSRQGQSSQISDSGGYGKKFRQGSGISQTSLFTWESGVVEPLPLTEASGTRWVNWEPAACLPSPTL